jgi:3-deoxy-D-manno-octulosonic-acid transferase
MIYRLLYNLLIHLGLPLALLALYKPKKGKPGFGARWAEHLGRLPPTGRKAPLWIHAVSVGETLAITPFIRALKAERPELPSCSPPPPAPAPNRRPSSGSGGAPLAPLDYPGPSRRF